MKKIKMAASLLCIFFSLVACNSEYKPVITPAPVTNPTLPTARTDVNVEKLVVGFAQLGEESEWRNAETNSIKEKAHELGVELKFANAQQKQENQIKAIRTFISQRVDVIAIAPVVETGWDTVFQEAKEAGIPIILVDRRAKISDDLYATFIGADFIEEGRNAAKEMARLLDGAGNVVQIEGTLGSSVAVERKKGFEDEINENFPNIKMIGSKYTDFTRENGKEVMESFLKADVVINGVYAHNDDMAIGAIAALDEAGINSGKDIKIVSVDGIKDAFEMMIAGKLNATIECNPLLGAQLFEAARKLKNGDKVEKWIKSYGEIFRQETAVSFIAGRKY